MGSSLLKGIISATLFFVGIFLISMVYKTQISTQRDAAAKEERDFERTTHINTIASAVAAYRDDHSRQLPALIGSEDKYICRSELFSDCGDLVDLRSLLSTYIVAFPSDPSAPFDSNTYYMIKINGSGQIVVTAPLSETQPIIATR